MTQPDDSMTPGEAIQAMLKQRNWTQDHLAKIISRYRPEISNLISGKRSVTPDIAVALGAAFGNSAEYWLTLESKRQLLFASEDPTEIRRRARLFELAPISDMEKRGWIKPGQSDKDLERSLCSFYQIESIFEAPSASVATRKTDATEPLSPQQLAWYYRARQLARAVTVSAFDRARLGDAQAKLRKLAAYRKEARHTAEVLAEYGIRFVIVEPLRRSKIDGAAFWLDDSSPCIAVSVRFDRIDAFWFTVMHEFAHIVAGDAMSLDSDLAGDDYIDSSMKDEIERRADQHAQEVLVPRSDLRSFIRRVGPLYSKERIIQFAHRMKIHPAMIVGQLQHLGEIGFSANREMLVKIRDVVTETSLTDGFGNIVPDSVLQE